MAKEQAMTAQDVDALKTEIASAVDDALTSAEGMTRTDALKAVCDSIMKLEAPKDLGGMGMDQGMGDMESMAEDQGGAEKETGAGE